MALGGEILGCRQKTNLQVTEPTTETLRKLFKPHLRLSRPRLTCFLMLVLAVLGQRTVSLVWLARYAAPPVKAESVYQRFFAYISQKFV